MQSYVQNGMMSNIQEQCPHSQDLASLLKQNISKSVKKFKASHQAQMAGSDTLSSKSEPPNKGKKLNTLVLLKQPISFSLLEDCDISHLDDMDEVLPKLEGWKIEIRQRDTKMCDTYYSHPSSTRKLRSITEVVNHILPEGHSKLPRRKKRYKVQEGISRNPKINLSPCNNYQNAKDIEDSLVSDFSTTNLQCLSEVLADSAFDYPILEDDQIEKMIQELKELL